MIAWLISAVVYTLLFYFFLRFPGEQAFFAGVLCGGVSVLAGKFLGK